jgi:alpha-glucosidase (family GH31 glycosyl hydrolase)
MNKLRSGYCGDLIWVDSSWLSPNYDHDAPHYIDFKFDPVQFPDPAGMIAALHKNHFKFGVWEWPYIDKSNPLFAHGESNGLFIKDTTGKVANGGGWHGVTYTGQFDYTNPVAAAWWKELNAPLVKMGFDFFKIDTYSTVAKGVVLADRTSSSENLRLRYHQAVFEVTQSASGGRGFILTHRTPTPGNDQFPGMWTGDTSASWKGFLEQDMGRAAKMNTLKDWHPDIEEFIDAKQTEEKKAWALIEQGYDGSYNGDAYGSVMYQNENLSVRVSDEFMQAALEGREWWTRRVRDGQPCE